MRRYLGKIFGFMLFVALFGTANLLLVELSHNLTSTFYAPLSASGLIAPPQIIVTLLQ
jgi:hypothetical protein